MTKLFNNLEKFKNKTALIDFNAKEYSYNEILVKVNYMKQPVFLEQLKRLRIYGVE